MLSACSCAAAPVVRDRLTISRSSPQKRHARPGLATLHTCARRVETLPGRQPWHLSASGDPGPSAEQVLPRRPSLSVSSLPTLSADLRRHSGHLRRCCKASPRSGSNDLVTLASFMFQAAAAGGCPRNPMRTCNRNRGSASSRGRMVMPLINSTGALSVVQKEAEKEELPPWARNEQARKLAAEDGSSGIPFGIYLLASALVAIAAVRTQHTLPRSRCTSIVTCSWLRGVVRHDRTLARRGAVC